MLHSEKILSISNGTCNEKYLQRYVSGLVTLCLLITITLFPPSAYAGDLNGSQSSSTEFTFSLDIKGDNNSITIHHPSPFTPPISIKGDNNSIAISDSFRHEDDGQDESHGFVGAVIDGAVQTLGTAAGAALVCYAADGLASTAFPPAVALAPVCSAIPGLFVGAKGVQLGVQGTKAVLKTAIIK